MERVLFIWAIRHPASGYVQGMNDLVTPFLHVFLSEHLRAGEKFETTNMDLVPQEALQEVSSGEITMNLPEVHLFDVPNLSLQNIYRVTIYEFFISAIRKSSMNYEIILNFLKYFLRLRVRNLRIRQVNLALRARCLARNYIPLLANLWNIYTAFAQMTSTRFKNA